MHVPPCRLLQVQTYKNTLKTKQSETFESSTSVTCSNTLSLEQSMGFSKSQHALLVPRESYLFINFLPE